MECFGTTDFDNNSRLITLSAFTISGLPPLYYILFSILLFSKSVCLLLLFVFTCSLTCCQAGWSRRLYFFDDFFKVRQNGLNAISPYARWDYHSCPHNGGELYINSTHAGTRVTNFGPLPIHGPRHHCRSFNSGDKIGLSCL
jgi:hypothetical protein